MVRKRHFSPEIRTIVMIDAVNFTSEMKMHGRDVIAPKINALREFVEFFFVYKLKGVIISEMGDGFLLLCPPEPHKVLAEAFSCMRFVRAYNAGLTLVKALNVRIAIHYGLVAPPDGGNYIDSNLNFAARLEGATPSNTVCVSAVVHDIVADILRQYSFTPMDANFKGLGQTRFYSVQHTSGVVAESTGEETRLGFYLSTIEALRYSGNWEAVCNACKQALVDFPGNPEFIYQLGFSALLIGDYETAIDAFEKSAELNYNRDDSVHFIGVAYADSGDEQAAIEQLTKVVHEYPEHFHTMLQLAEIFFARKEFETAWSWAEGAVHHAPRYYAPRALQIALVFALNKELPLEGLITGVPARNRRSFREAVNRYLEKADLVCDENVIDLAFKAVFDRK